LEYIDVAEDGEKWRALVSTVMNLQVPLNLGNFSLAEKMLSSQEALCPMELANWTD
jgi:hypothetical protein